MTGRLLVALLALARAWPVDAQAQKRGGRPPRPESQARVIFGRGWT
jgi:hypothetical protein